MMRYAYTTFYWIKGIAPSVGQSDVPIASSSSANMSAVLTSRLDRRWPQVDRNVAVANTILNRMSFGTDASLGFEGQVSLELETIQEERTRKYGRSAVYLVVEFSGHADGVATEEHEYADFVLSRDGPSKFAIRRQHSESLNAIRVATALLLDSVLGVEAVSDAVTFWRSDGKHVYSYRLTGSAQGFVSRQLDPSNLGASGDVFHALATDHWLDSVTRLLLASFENSQDRLRSFLFGWTALEIFVNKVFKHHGVAFFAALALGDHPVISALSLKRVRAVTKDKYTLLDKFILIVLQLSPEEPNQDVDEFKQAKDRRDDLVHGQVIAESELPTETVQRLARKYLLLHLHVRDNIERSQRPPTGAGDTPDTVP